MRLKIVVKRHGLPDSPIVWAIENDPSISQILEQVNEILPLESGSDWGLEDYAFELKSASGHGFECLHFQNASQVLKDGDEVIIRPLLTQDVRQRKLSGRHQLSTDGRHLIDGFPFGRPKLRGPYNRPSLDIPPRKRRRILLDETGDQEEDELLALMDEEDAEDVEYHDGDKQMVLHADFEDADNMDDSSEDEDDEVPYEPTAEDMSQMAAELEELQDEELERDLQHPEDGQYSQAPDLQDESLSEKLRMLRKAFPQAPKAVCKSILHQVDGDLGNAWDMLSQGFPPCQSRNHIQKARTTDHSSYSASAQSPKASPVSERSRDSISEVNEDQDEEVQDDPIVQYYDEHGLASGSISSGKPLTHKAKIVFGSDDEFVTDQPNVPRSRRSSNRSVRFADEEPTVLAIEPTAIDEDDDESDDEDFDAQSESDNDSESDASSESSSGSDSSSDSSSEDDEEAITHPTSPSEATSSSSEDSSSESSDSDSEPEETSSKLPTTRLTKSSESIVAANSPRSIPPGKGKKATQARNSRRRAQNALRRFQSQGLLPAGTTLTEFAQLNMAGIETPEAASEALAAVKEAIKKQVTGETKKRDRSDQSAEDAKDFAARRQQLLESLASGGVEAVEEPTRQRKNTTSSSTKAAKSTVTDRNPEESIATDGALPVEAISASAAQGNATSSERPPATSGAQIDSSPRAEPEIAPLESTSSSTRKRAKLDMGAGRRLLFGALGIKTPRNKQDEEKVKSDLMKFAKPLKVADMANEDSVQSSEAIDEHSDAWKEKLILRAVECCYEGVEYSEPPFPFVQRWDPQQQGGYSYGKRGGKGKKNKRNQTHFYDSSLPNKRQKQSDGYDEVAADESYYDAHEDSFNQAIDASMIDADVDIHDQLMRDTYGGDPEQGDNDDLPALPDDLSLLPILTVEDVKPGAVVAFKQLIMSEATQWQPKMSEYRTAVVIQVPSDGFFELRLAKRDREIKERYYDEITGERLYGRLEAPDDENDDEFEDDGYLEANFHDFVDGKLLQAALGAGTNKDTGLVGSMTNGHNENSNLKDSREFMADDCALNEDTRIEGMENDDTATMRGEELMVNISDQDRQEISHFIRDIGFQSSVPPSAGQLSRHHESTPHEASHSSSSPQPYSPKFNGLSSPMHSVEPGAEALVHNQLDSTASSIQYPSLPCVSSQQPYDSQTHSHATDKGRQPGFSQDCDVAIDRFEDVEFDLSEEHKDYSQISEPISSTSYDQMKLPLVSSPIQPDLLSSPINPSSELPELDEIFELYSTARSSRSSNVPQREISNLESALGASDVVKEPFVIPPGSQQVNLVSSEMNSGSELELDTRSNDTSSTKPKLIKPRSSPDPTVRTARKSPRQGRKRKTSESSDIEYDDSFGLPAGPGWVPKSTKRVGRRASQSQSQTKSQQSNGASGNRRSGRRKTANV